ncbi:MAG: lasso peptide biosynthesis B2 protein [Terricaulis sp.]
MNCAELNLKGHVRACLAGDWIVLLDLRGDRYWALPQSMSQGAMRNRLAKHGFLRADEEPLPKRIPPLFSGSGAPSRMPDLALALRSGLWAHGVVKSGRIDKAFSLIERRKRKLVTIGADGARAVIARFDELRPWLPWRYVCLFNSLCLSRFLLEHGVAADLVIGVRARPFAAHAWVELEGRVLDPGNEDCPSFVEIARA